MSNQPRKRTVKLTKSFCAYHPDFETTADGYKLLPTGKYIVEWIVKEWGNQIDEHYCVEFNTQQEAKDFLLQLDNSGASPCRYIDFPTNSIIFSGKKTFIDAKKLAIEKNKQIKEQQ